MSQSFQVTRRVEFRDTDMAGIVHFSVFFTYMEQAEHEFLRSLGLGVIAKVEGQEISWPRVSATCDYRRAIKFEQLIDITLRVSRIGEKSVSYDFRFEHSGQLVAEGRIGGLLPFSARIPTTISAHPPFAPREVDSVLD